MGEHRGSGTCMGAHRGSPPATRDVHTQGACAAAAAGQGSMVEKPPLIGAADAAFHLPAATRLLRAALCSREQRTRHIGMDMDMDAGERQPAAL